MRYAEHPIPPALEGLVTAIWTLQGDGAPDERVAHDATPDGCIELIRRIEGQSWWGSEQPELFATGLTETPVRFTMSGDARFVGVRLWPWAWAEIGGMPAPAFAGRWIPIDAGSRPGILLAETDRIAEALAETLAGGSHDPIAAAIPRSNSVGEIVATSGVSHRGVQRWFARYIGIAPRRYIRLIRFRAAMLDFADPPATLAEQSSAHGFADQAHMARDFRALAGVPPRDARARAVGPFLPGTR